MQNKLRLSPEIALEMLQEGNRHFTAGFLRRPGTGPVSMAMHADRQRPFAAVLTCSDSRVSPELIFDCGIGDVFVIRTAGNVVEPVGIGSVEYAVEYLNLPLVVVMGHTRCGAVESAIDGQSLPGYMDQIINKIRPAVTAVRASYPGLQGEELVNEVARVNARNGVTELLNGSTLLRRACEQGRIRVVSAMCDIANGAVRWLDVDVAESAVELKALD